MSRKSFFRLTAVLAAVLLAGGASIGAAQSKAQQPAMPKETGLLVVSVYPGSPAEKAGISRGDIILAAGGKEVNRISDLYGVMAPLKSGDTLALTIKHGDAQRALTATLEERDGRTYLGVMLYPAVGWFGRPLARREERGLQRAAPGALIESVVKDSPADKAGLKEGEIIVSVDGVNVGPGNDLSALIQKHKTGETVTLSVRDRKTGLRDVEAVLGKNPENPDQPYLGVQYNPRLFAPPMMWDRDGRFYGPRGFHGPMHPWGRGPGDGDEPGQSAAPSPEGQGI